MAKGTMVGGAGWSAGGRGVRKGGLEGERLVMYRRVLSLPFGRKLGRGRRDGRGGERRNEVKVDAGRSNRPGE